MGLNTRTGSMFAGLLVLIGLVGAAPQSARAQAIDPKGFCRNLDVNDGGSDCLYKETDTEEENVLGTGKEDKAVEVRTKPITGRVDILIGHKTYEDGYFYRTTAKDNLRKAIYFKRGVGSKIVPNEQVRNRFDKEVAFWLEWLRQQELTWKARYGRDHEAGVVASLRKTGK